MECLQVSNDGDASSISAFTLQVASLTVECMATERVDRTWVSDSDMSQHHILVEQNTLVLSVPLTLRNASPQISLAYAAEISPLEKDSR